MKSWPGGGATPARPVAGGRAEVTLAGTGRGGSNAFLDRVLGRKKQQALVIFTRPASSSWRTIKGNMTIGYVMDWCAAFNAECERLGNRSASGVAPRSDALDEVKNVSSTERAVAKATVVSARATTFAAIIAAISLAASSAAVVISLHQENLARQQNINAEQQDLLSIVTDIEQLQNSPQSFERTLADVESAQYIIQALHNMGIPAIEKYEIGTALDNVAEFQPALTLLENAARESSDPLNEAQSWRGVANVRYELNQNEQAEKAIQLAKIAFTAGNSTMIDVENNVAYTDFYDIPRISAIDRDKNSPGCKTSVAEWNEATQEIKLHPDIADKSVTTQENIAKKNLIKNCQYP